MSTLLELGGGGGNDDLSLKDQSILQEFCRTCLRKLNEWRSSSTTDDGTTTTTLSMKFAYDLENIPQIMKLLTIIASVNAYNDDDDDGNFESLYPKSLCHICYEKFLDLQEFRLMIIQSTERLNEIIGRLRDKRSSPNSEVTYPSFNESAVKSEENSSDQEYQNEESTKGRETMDIEDVDRMYNVVKTESISSLQDNNSEIKIEIDSEFEDNADDPTVEDNFYEQNALNVMDDNSAECHIGKQSEGQYTKESGVADAADDADDEEQSLRSGAANASSSSLKPAHHTAKNLTRQRKKKSLKCPRCDKQVYKQVYLDAHIRAVHEGHAKPFLCSECQKAFTRYNQLHIHIKSNHMVEVEYVCDFNDCKATFKMSQTLETHRKVVHTDGPFSIELKDFEMHEKHLYKEMELDNFCQQCNRKYSSKRALNEHVKRHSKIRDHVCKVCGAAKVTRSELSTHMRVHETNLEKFKCSLCPQLFNHKNAIARHVRVVHENQKNFTCTFCPRKFGTQNSKTSHERLHTNEKPFKCDDCSRCFAQKQGLRSHMKNHDKSSRKHVCSYCEKRFLTRSNLQYHEERHRGDKPFICATCNQGFPGKDDLQAHSKQLHSTDNESQPTGVNLRLESATSTCVPPRNNDESIS